MFKLFKWAWTNEVLFFPTDDAQATALDIDGNFWTIEEARKDHWIEMTLPNYMMEIDTEHK